MKNSVRALVALSCLFGGKIAHAQTPYSMRMADSIEYGWLGRVVSRLSSAPTLDSRHPSLSPQERFACEQNYRKVLNRGRIDIRLAFGYMDISEGVDYVFGSENFGNAGSIDIFGHEAMRRVLTGPCKGQMRACGFQVHPQEPDFLWKTVTGPAGEQVTAVIQLNRASASPYYLENKGILSSLQAELTERAERNFFGGIGSVDAVFYMGHARNGGGPDFNPPILKKDGHVNYSGYYMKKKPGFNRLLSALRSAAEKPMLVSLGACLSEHHFGKSLKAAAPETGLLLTDSTELANYDDIVQGALASVDSLLRMQCRTGFQNALDNSATERPRIVMRQFLGAPSVDPNAKPAETRLTRH